MKYTVAVAQFAIVRERADNIRAAHSWIKRAAAAHAQVLLLPELFEFPYFPIERGADQYFSEATSLTLHPYVDEFQAAARKYNLALPFSFFECAEGQYYNSLAWITERGEVAGIYRKTHLPKGRGYEEDYYFTPGTKPVPPAEHPFPIWQADGGSRDLSAGNVARKVRVGTGICWDQWFTEPARIMALHGAELLLYPTAIGTEPGWEQPQYSSRFHWQQVMCGHAAANVLPVAAANRIGIERALNSELALTFYGSSFIADQEGRVVAQLGEAEEGLLVHTFNLDAIAKFRSYWGLSSARRPELYSSLSTTPVVNSQKPR